MKKPSRPRRQKKSDRILHSDQTKKQIMCDYSIAPFDRKSDEMDEKWGIDRLVELVSPDTAAKYGSAMAKLNDAINEGDPAVVSARAQVCIRGMDAMDAEAASAGAQRASLDFWQVEVGGEVYGVMRDARGWKGIKAQQPDIQLVTLREVAIALQVWKDTRLAEYAAAMRESFGEQAEVVKYTKKELNDDIPF